MIPKPPAASATPAAPAAPGFSAGDGLINAVGAAARRLMALTPAEIAVNLTLSAVVIAAAFGLIFGFRYLVNRRLSHLAGDEDADRLRGSRTLRWGGAALRLVLILGAIWLLLTIWGLNPLAWWTGSGGREVVRVGARILVLSLILLAASEASAFAIRRTMGNLADASRDRRRSAQLRTLAPLLRGLVQAVILVVAVMMVLSELGVQIGPLIAGAGVAGIAIGFGAQSVVKDVLTGFFLIIEDIVSVGDSVRIGNFSGDVETMTLRTIRLRDFDGTLHIFPYGEAQVIHNQTKAFSYAVIDLQISYGSDVDAAMKAMAEVGEAMQADPEYGPKILAPMEVLGVENLKEDGFQLRGRIKTRTRADPSVTREFNRLIKSAFDEKGVVIAYPYMRLAAVHEGEEIVPVPAMRQG